MNFLKKIWAWEKAMMKKPETHSAIGMIGGLLIGVGMDNIGVGVALGIALGVPVYVTGKKKKEKEEEESTEEKEETNSTKDT